MFYMRTYVPVNPDLRRSIIWNVTNAHSQGIIEAALDCIVSMDELGIVREFNPAAVRTFGYSREEAVGRRLAELIVPPELREAHERGFRRYIATAESEVLGRRIELTAMRADGSLFPMELAISKMEDGSDGSTLFVGFIRDLSELRSAELLYRTVIEHLPLAAYRNRATDYPATLYMSPQIEDMLGYPADAWLGDDNGFYGSVVHPDDLERANAECADARAAGVPFRSEYRMVHNDGTTVWVLDQSTIVRDEGGAPLFAQGFLLDITEQKRLEEQLRQSQKMDAIGQLAGGVAHDFNNMLTAISGYADLLALSFEGSGDPRVDDVEQIRKAAGHAAALTRQLLAFGRKQMLRPQRLEVNDVVRDLEKMLARTIGGEVELEVSLADGLASVETDPDQLVQVILNIALNGRDAMPGGGLLRVATGSVESDGDRFVSVEVSDTGTGIDERVRNRMFEPFFTTKDQGKGTGLGLATAYGVVSQSGGRIEVETALGEGSTFRVLLPAAA
jgi:two-component system, cell cycle sensor histidine kinase and response regulator CckA